MLGKYGRNKWEHYRGYKRRGSQRLSWPSFLSHCLVRGHSGKVSPLALSLHASGQPVSLQLSTEVWVTQLKRVCLVWALWDTTQQDRGGEWKVEARSFWNPRRIKEGRAFGRISIWRNLLHSFLRQDFSESCRKECLIQCLDKWHLGKYPVLLNSMADHGKKNRAGNGSRENGPKKGFT